MSGVPTVACIGAGVWGRNLIRNFHDLGHLAAICEPERARREELQEAYPEIALHTRIDDVLDDDGVTAVAIATPVVTHGALVRTALSADKDVFVEKPLCLSTVEGRSLVELAEERGRILMVGDVLWYHPAVLRLKDLVEEGELGRVLYIYSHRLNLGRIRREENILWSFAPHDVSVILGLVGEMPDRAEAQGGNYLHEAIADVTVSLLSFPSGVKAHIFVSWLHPFKEQKLVVVGDRKMAVFDDTEPQEKLRLYPHTIEWRNHVPVARGAEGETVEYDRVEPLRAECAHFVDCVERRTTPRTDGARALRVLEVLEACERSLANGSRPTGVGADTAAPYYVHESACLDEDVEIGAGTRIWHFCHVMRGARIGADCRIGQNVLIGPGVRIGDGVKIQNNVSVYEGVTLEDHVFCGPSVVFTNVRNPRSEIPRMSELQPTLVKRGATLGANATILCGLTIGRYAFVGAGAVVLEDVPDHALVVGNPGRVIGWMCACGARVRDDDDTCEDCGREYVRAADGLTPATDSTPAPRAAG